MSKKNDGGSAFPTAVDVIAGSIIHTPGMSLRDHFAGQALVGLLANQVTTGAKISEYASDAYTAADAMLAEREK